MSSLQITRETFSSLHAKWSSLLEDSAKPQIFTTPTWHQSWWSHFGDGYELLLLSFENCNDLTAIAPFKLKDGHLSLVGSPDICDYMDFIVRKGSEPEAYRVMVDHILDIGWTTLSLSGISMTSPTYTMLPSLLRSKGLSVEVSPEDVCPGIDLPSSWDDYLASLGKKDRHELRRKIRRLYSAGEARYYCIQDPDQFPQHVDKFLHMLANSRVDKAHFLTTDIALFFRDVLTKLASEGKARLSFLEIDGKQVSTAVCFDYRNEFLLYNSGYDTDYSNLSVGLLVKAFCIKEAIELGRKKFNFLRGSENYKYHFGAVDEPLYTISASR